MSVKVQRLRVLMNERLTAAAEEIFALFERTIAEYEEEMCRSKEENKRKQQLLDSGLKPQVLLHRTDAQIQVVSLNIKEEQQNYISLQKVQPPESASTPVQRQTEENREDAEAEDISSTDQQGHLESETERRSESNEVWEPPCSSSDQQKATEADGDDTDQVRKEHSDNPAAAQNSGLFTKSKKTGKKRSRGTILGERRCNIMHDCEVCGDTFRGNGGNLRRHMLVHKRERPFSCSVCKTGFTQEDQLEEHMETHRDNDKEESVLLQKKTEEDRERTEGEDCGGAEIGMSLDSNTSGPEREAEKTEKKEPDQQMETEAERDVCSQVHKEESDKPTAAQNPGLFTKSKSKEKNCVQKCNVMHECEVCGDKVRGNSGNFQRHMLVHKRERPFSCSVCKTGFTLKAQLEEHIETHRDNDKESVLLQQKKTEENREDTEGEDMNNGISAGKKVNQCSVCVKTFTTKARLTRHMSVHTGEKPYNCPVCKKSFAQKYNLQTHMPVHTGEKPFSCSLCQKSYRRKDDLRTHMSTHTGEVLFSCLVCNAGFRQRNSLRTHMRIHTGDRPFRCSLCSVQIQSVTHKEVGSSLTEENTESAHIKEETQKLSIKQEVEFTAVQGFRETEPDININPQGRLQCDHYSQTDISFHPRHEQMKTEAHSEVEKSYSNKRTAAGNTNYKSNSVRNGRRCSKGVQIQPMSKEEVGLCLQQEPEEPMWVQVFPVKNLCKSEEQFKQKLTEENRGKTEGDDCGREESDVSLDPHRHLESDTKEHTENSDNGDERIQAMAVDGNDYNKVRTKDLNVNTAAQNSNPYFMIKRSAARKTPLNLQECDVCEKSFRRVCDLQRHVKVHTGEKPFSCSVCTKAFTQGNLKTHMRTHTGEKPFSCSECNAVFAQRITLQQHMLTHTGEKPHSCLLCNKSFALIGQLKLHERTHTGEKPFSCPVCGKAFSQKCNLSTHKRRHGERRPKRSSVVSGSRAKKT